MAMASTLQIGVTAAICCLVSSYRIAMFPQAGKSHVFSLVAVADALAARGHQTTVVISESMRVDLPEVRGATGKDGRDAGVLLERYKDHIVGDMEETYANITIMSLEEQITAFDQIPIIAQLYVITVL